jgi:glycosyltransferase involved in cell wall biosynthesis
MNQRIIVSVISDLATDQRVHKVCQTLRDAGYEVVLYGTRRKGSLALSPRDYQTRRIRMLFQRKLLFYAEFNLRLFFSLLFNKADILLGNDLDVMAATYLAARVKGKPVVYDTHEYYLGMAGLEQKRWRKKIWKILESYIFSRVKYIYTVSDSVRDLYLQDYHKPMEVVRNFPLKNKKTAVGYDGLIQSLDAKIPRDKHLLLYQGAGINPHRGVEELVMAMQFLDRDQYHLLLIGGGDVFRDIVERVARNGLGDRITIFPKLPFEVLDHFTRQADLGFSIDKPDNVNHRNGLPNKLFEYIHAGVPVLASRLPEQEKIILEYRVGAFIDHHDPVHIAARIREIFADPGLIKYWKSNTEKAREFLNWENEGKIVTRIFKQVESQGG